MTVSLVLHGVALVAIYSVYGVFQEKLIKTSYGDDVEHFESTSLLILCNRLFAMVVGVLILAWKRRRSNDSLLRSLRPTSPLHHFALVALYNFLSTSCQYQALSFVSFTTASLAKTTKMIPVIVVGALVFKKRTSPREWIAAAVIALGCATYLSTSTGEMSPLDDDDIFLDTIMGTIYLAGYLFFDGMTSTSQERYFGLSASSTDPFGPDSSVLPQMIYVNLFSCVYSLGGIGLDMASGNFLPSFHLLLTTPALQRDVFILSATAATGLVVLLNTIASFGALSSAFLMTIRQFFSIILNAGVFRHFLSVGLQGWCGVGWVASGVWIKINASEEDKASVDDSYYERLDEEALLSDKDSASSRSSSPTGSPRLASHEFSGNFVHHPFSYYAKNYVLPIVAPLVLSAALLYAFPEFAARIVQPESNLGSIQYATHSTTSNGGAKDGQMVAVEGGQWEKELVDAIWPECNATETERWLGKTKTALASFPRSGNTFTRELVERASNFQTSTAGYCDHSLRLTLHGECDDDATFLVKTHYPEKAYEKDAQYVDQQSFDQVVHLIRNPIDSLISGWQLGHVPKTSEGQLDHSGKLDIDSLGASSAERADIMSRAAIYLNHYEFWKRVNIPAHSLRYEDLMTARLPTLMNLLAFLLPDELPSLTQIACALELDESKEAYKSRKAPEFASWGMWDPKLRTEIITMLKEPWCHYHYDQLLRKSVGRDTGVDSICDS